MNANGYLLWAPAQISNQLYLYYINLYSNDSTYVGYTPIKENKFPYNNTYG